MSLRIHRQIGPTRKVLPQQAIGVLVGPALPRTLRVAEVNIDVGRQRKSSIIRKFLATVAVHLNFQNRQCVQRRRCPSSPHQHQSTASTLVNAYCVAGEFGFPAGFGAEPVTGPTWTASPLCNVSGALSITWSCGDRPAVTSTVSPKSRPSWIA